jgi:hypothetical protein
VNDKNPKEIFLIAATCKKCLGSIVLCTRKQRTWLRFAEGRLLGKETLLCNTQDEKEGAFFPLPLGNSML